MGNLLRGSAADKANLLYPICINLFRVECRNNCNAMIQNVSFQSLVWVKESNQDGNAQIAIVVSGEFNV